MRPSSAGRAKSRAPHGNNGTDKVSASQSTQMELGMPNPLITAPGPRLSQAAMERLSYEIYRPKAKDDAPGNEVLLGSLPRSALELLVGSLTSPPPPGGSD